MKKVFCILVTALILLFPAVLFAGENANSESTQFFFTLGPVGMLNTDTLSAPSPIQFSCGFGADIPVTNWFAVSPSMSIFTTYYLWRDDATGARAYPAEVENRTALAPSTIIDVPAVFSLHAGNNSFALGLGAAFFARYAFLADSVPKAEAGDIKRINSFFYSNLRFLYPSVQFTYDFKTENGMKAGVVLKAFIPLASLMEDRGLDGGMAGIAFRMTLPGKTE